MHLKPYTLLALAMVLGGTASPASALTINLIGTDANTAVGTQAYNGFKAAAGLWENLLKDNVTVNVAIGYQSLGGSTLGQAGSSEGTVSYNTFKTVLAADQTSITDRTAVSHLPSGGSFGMLTNRTSNHPTSAGNATPYLDNDGDANNYTVRMTTANAKALGLLAPHDSALDAAITFSSDFSFDFDRGNGIGAGAFDFIGIAAHEIGHALGFISGVDILDINSPNGSTYYRDDQFNQVSPLDLFRYSALSLQNQVIDWAADNRDKYFSIDGGTTNLGLFATGVKHGDGRQASHWKDGLGLGLLDPTAAPRELLALTPLDLLAMDTIGWDLPEPGTPLLILAGLGAWRRWARR